MGKFRWLCALAFYFQLGWAAEPGTVLLLNSYHTQYRWTAELTRGVQETLEQTIAPESLHVEYMDARRFVHDPEYNAKLITLLKHKYSHYHPDVIITSDDHAYYFMIEHGETLFADTPIVFCGVNVFYPDTLAGKPHIVGILEGMEIEGNLALIRRLQPDVTRIIMLGDTTGLGGRMVEKAKGIKTLWQATPENTDIELDIWDRFTLEGLYQRVSELPPGSAILMLAIHKDLNGEYFSFNEHLNILSQRSNVPIYGMWGGLMIGNGVLGGMMNNPYQHGSDAAHMALAILDGVAPSSLGVKEKALYRPYFDYLQLQRFRIPLDNLPPQSTVANQPQSLYRHYQNIINGVLALVTALVVIISLLLANIRQRQGVAVKLKTFNQQLEEEVRQRTVVLQERNEELLAVSQKMEHMAHSDSLTGLSNRRAATREVSAYIRRFEKDATPLALALLDVDHFKKINDGFGHDVGDAVLRTLADTLSNTLRPSDRVYRWGGEEFFILLPETELTDAYQVCQRLRQVISHLAIDVIGRLTVSIGVAAFHHGDSFDRVVQRADKALYKAKADGRNRVSAADHAKHG